jgi:hypothetical protein
VGRLKTEQEQQVSAHDLAVGRLKAEQEQQGSAHDLAVGRLKAAQEQQLQRLQQQHSKVTLSLPAAHAPCWSAAVQCPSILARTCKCRAQDNTHCTMHRTCTAAAHRHVPMVPSRVAGCAELLTRTGQQQREAAML